MIAMASYEWQNRLDAGWAEAKATPRNKRVTLRFWVSEARLCNSILDGMRRL